jgi:hypothetical protein
VRFFLKFPGKYEFQPVIRIWMYFSFREFGQIALARYPLLGIRVGFPALESMVQLNNLFFSFPWIAGNHHAYRRKQKTGS